MMRTDDREPYGLWAKRLGWLLLLWLFGVGALGVVAIALKLMMHLAGLTS